jgi:hypothetical protein
MAASVSASAWRRPVLLAVGVAAVPSALALRSAWRPADDGRAAPARPRAASTAAAGAAGVGRDAAALARVDTMTVWLPAADAGPRAWAAVGAAVAAPGLALGLAIGLAPLARPGGDPLTARHLQGAALGVAALGIATVLVAGAGWVGKLAVFSALGVQDSSGFIAEMRLRVPVLAAFWQQQVGPLKAALQPVTAEMGGRFQAAADSMGIEEAAAQYLGLDISVEDDDSDPLGDLGDDPLQTLVDRVSASDDKCAREAGAEA